MNKFNILYIQHADEVSGSLVSLYYTVKGVLSKSDKPVDYDILCKSENICSWHKKNGLNASYFSCISIIGHCSGHYYNFFNIIDIIKFIKQLLILPFSVFAQYFYFRSCQQEIIHLNSSVLLSSALAAKLAQKKVVWHIREVLQDGFFGIRKKIWQFLYLHLSDTIICISELEARKISTKPQHKIEILYDFVPIEDFYPHSNSSDIRKNLSLQEKDKIILSLGGTNPIKGTSYLIKSLYHLPDNYHLVIAGDSRFYHEFSKSRFKKCLSILKLLFGSWGSLEYWRIQKYLSSFKDRVHFTGPIKNVPDFINSSDLLYFGGTTPHFPRPVFEAWLLNKPVMAFDIDGPRQYIVNGKNGYMAELGNAKQLANLIMKITNNHELSKNLAQNGNLLAKEKFNLSKNISRLLEIYQGLSR